MSQKSRFSRHLALDDWSEESQSRLAEGSALVVGVGGLGCPASLYLAAAGLGSLLLNDFDRVDETNLVRQILFGAEDIGKPKPDAARKRLLAQYPDVRITTIPERLDEQALTEAVAAVTIVLDCSDNYPTRLAVNQACVKTGKPLVSGAAQQFQGQVVSLPARGQPCFRCLYSEDDDALGDCQGAGVFSTVVGTIGLAMAHQVLRIFGGISPGPLLQIFDGAANEWRTLQVEKDSDCPVCGSGSS